MGDRHKWHGDGVRRVHTHEKKPGGTKEEPMSTQDESKQRVEVPAQKPAPNVESIPAPLPVDDDEFAFDMPDMPMPEEHAEPVVIKDRFKSACKFAFLGIGRAGGRIVEAFHKLGYSRVCAINTARQDLDEVELADANKLWLGAGGASGIRSQGAHYVKDHYEEIMDVMIRSFGTDFDRIIICISAGGGTGSGGVEAAVVIANALVEYLRLKKTGEKTQVGVMVALPTNSERTCMSNTYQAMKFIGAQVDAKLLSPVIVIDNEHVSRQHPGATVGNIWDKINQSAVSLLHIFNAISVAPTRHIAMDPADLSTVLDSGVITYGATALGNTSAEGISKTMTDNVKNNVLCGGVDLTDATVAGCIVAGKSEELAGLNAQDIDHHCFEKLERITDGADVYRGIYTTKQPLAAYTIFGGMGLPKERLDEIARLSGHVDWDE